MLKHRYVLETAWKTEPRWISRRRLHELVYDLQSIKKLQTFTSAY